MISGSLGKAEAQVRSPCTLPATAALKCTLEILRPFLVLKDFRGDEIFLAKGLFGLRFSDWDTKGLISLLL